MNEQMLWLATITLLAATVSNAGIRVLVDHRSWPSCSCRIASSTLR